MAFIFLHGGQVYWSKSFSKLAGNLLESHLKMIYLDQRGCGRSLHHSGDYSLERLVRDVDEVRKSLNVREFYLMGHSFGGIIAVHYAYHSSQNTKGVLLTNATLIGGIKL